MTKRTERAKAVKAWGLIDEDDALMPYGNGYQFQYPVFPTKKEAMEYKKVIDWRYTKIVRVEIREVSNGTK